MFKRIYRHYNLLIDFCFWVQLYAFSKAILQDFGVLPRPLYPYNAFGNTLYILHNALVIPALMMLPILLVVRRFRDEFAEAIWQNTTRTFSVVLILVPWIWFAFWQVGMELNGGLDWFLGLDIPQFVNHPIAHQDLKASGGVRELLSIDFVFQFLGIFGPFLFAAIYKWHRWRSEG